MTAEERKGKVWNRAKVIRGKDPGRYRQDPYGHPMYWSSYNKNSEMGWEIDHIKPKSKGGSDSIRNLQALNLRVNRSKGNTLRKKSRHSKANK